MHKRGLTTLASRDWVHRTIVLEDHLLLEGTRVGSDHLLVMPLCDFRLTQVAIFADGYLMLSFIIESAYFFDRRTHRKSPLGNQNQLRTKAVGDRVGGLCIHLTTQMEDPKNQYA